MVQGVFYRASARDEAKKYGIKGYARNQADGTVYIEAEGEEDKLELFIAWCKRGPARAVVSNVEVSEGELKNFSAFEIQF